MAISLSKGGNISLSKTDPTMTKMLIGLGWDPRATDGKDFDLDASLFMLNADGKARSEKDFIFYRNLTSPEGAITHTGDNRTGEGDGDDEAIKVDLSKVPADIEKLQIVVTIHDAAVNNQSFGQVGGAFMRVINEDSGNEVSRYDLQEEAGTETAMIFGEIYRYNGEWKFRAVGQGHQGGLAALCAMVGISAS